MLADAAHRLLARLTDAPSAVLDLGTGTGSLAFAAAERWPKARVIGLDASAGMVSVARHRASSGHSAQGGHRGHGAHGEHGPGRLEWLVADAAAIPLDAASVDVVTCAFMLQLVPERTAVLAEVRRVLRPAGTFAFVTWQAEELLLAADAAFDEAVYELDVDEPEPPVDDPGEGEYESLEAARDELLAAGFEDVEVVPDRLEHTWSREEYARFKEDYDERDLFESLASADRDRLRALVAARWAGLPGDAFTLRAPLVSAVAR